MQLVLFDIDGTLLLSGGAGTRALSRALQEIYGFSNGLSGVRPAGKTDPQIVREVLRRYGTDDTFSPAEISPLFALYVSFLREELSKSENFLVLPGAFDLVRTLSRNENISLGLATGNIEEGAMMKLERAGLSSFFSFGAYGSDAEERTQLIRLAIERGQAGPAVAPEQIFVIGDTPRDIVHGKEAGARTIAVASGTYSLDALRAYKPDLSIASLDPIDVVMEFLETSSVS